MSSEQQTTDAITDAVLSGSAYERLRVCRHSMVGQPLTRLLSVQGLLLAVLAATVPLYWLIPDSVATYLPTTDPLTATPKIAMLGAFGGVIVFFSAMLLVGTALYRLEHAPLSESQAHEVLVVEDFTGGLTVGMGGLAVVLTVACLGMGLLGGETVGTYVATMDGTNPFASSLYALPLGTLGTTALAASVVVFGARWYVGRRFEQL